ncbi:MAG: HAMP domain-containing histidine kinase [Candidatus Kaiserbacteria bacterium]|nr:MAG: HAMP domain-containing histidine kinase [Candidatus Kaiserbacteria bacterium]
MDINTCLATTAEFRDLALYSHLIPAIATLILGMFALRRAQNKLKAAYFFAFSAAFALWLLGDMAVWMLDSYHLVAAFWSPLDFTEIAFFLLLFGFVCVDLLPSVPREYSYLLLGAAIVPFLITIGGSAVLEMYQPVCEMENNEFLSAYKVWLEGLILAAILVLGAWRTLSASTWSERIRIALVVLAVVLFLGIFAGTEFIATASGIFEINLYALFTLPIFILMLTISITSYGTFRLGDEAVKALFYVFLILAGTQFFFVQDILGFLLALMSFGVVLTLGLLLFRSNEREIEARHALEIANQQQENLLHFISHEVKGYLTESQAGFAAIAEGDFGEVAAPLKSMAGSALASVRRGVATVMDILDASNLKKGTMAFNKQPFDFKKAVLEVIGDLQKNAAEKSLTIETKITERETKVEGDEDKIRRHVIRNLIDNAIKYTPHGAIEVAVSASGEVVRLTVQDNGVGITAEDKKRLFTEGGHGKDSIKVNVHSTGYGLFIAKSIVDAHRGRIWAESDGNGKGARFLVEFPIE